jgi:hypothetical protein
MMVSSGEQPADRLQCLSPARPARALIGFGRLRARRRIGVKSMNSTFAATGQQIYITSVSVISWHILNSNLTTWMVTKYLHTPRVTCTPLLSSLWKRFRSVTTFKMAAYFRSPVSRSSSFLHVSLVTRRIFLVFARVALQWYYQPTRLV